MSLFKLHGHWKVFYFFPCYHLYKLNVIKCDAADIFLHHTFLCDMLIFKSIDKMLVDTKPYG